MEVRREHDRFPIQIMLVVIGLAVALLLGGGAGYAIRGPVAPQPTVSQAATRDQVEDWMRQGAGPTDADALQAQERTESATGKP